MGTPRAPWTEIGSLQSDIHNLRSEIGRKAESHEVHSLNRRLDTLEHTCREIGSKVDDFVYKLQELEEARQRKDES